MSIFYTTKIRNNLLAISFIYYLSLHGWYVVDWFRWRCFRENASGNEKNSAMLGVTYCSRKYTKWRFTFLFGLISHDTNLNSPRCLKAEAEKEVIVVKQILQEAYVDRSLFPGSKWVIVWGILPLWCWLVSRFDILVVTCAIYIPRCLILPML